MTPPSTKISAGLIFGNQGQDDGIVGIETKRPFGIVPGQSPGFVGRRELGSQFA